MSSNIFTMCMFHVSYSALLISLTYCTPINHAVTYQHATSCNGTECYNNPDYYEKNITGNTNIPDNVSDAILNVLPEMMERHEQHIAAVNSGVEAQTQFMRNMRRNMTTTMENMNRLLGNHLIILNEILPQTDCNHVFKRGMSHNGVYTIVPRQDARPLQVYCDMETDGGPWIVFQKRFDGSVDFYQTWSKYESGFGNADGEYWLGLENIYELTRTGQWQLRVDIGTYSGETYYALYDSFSVGDGTTNYRLHVSGYSGTARDALSFIDGRPFSTWDRDSTGLDCAEVRKGGWWFHDGCISLNGGNMNGLYREPWCCFPQRLISWDFMSTGLKKTEMKMRLLN